MGYALPYIVLVLSGALAFSGLMALWVPGRIRRPMGFYLFLGAGLQFAMVAPVAVIQGAFVMGPRTPPEVSTSLNPAAARDAAARSGRESPGRVASQPPPLRIALSIVAMPVHLGGLSTRLVFEALHGPLKRPDRGYPSTALASAVSLTAMATFQVLGLGWIFASLVRRTGNLRDPRVLALGGFVFLNALLNIAWPWWGS